MDVEDLSFATTSGPSGRIFASPVDILKPIQVLLFQICKSHMVPCPYGHSCAEDSGVSCIFQKVVQDPPKPQLSPTSY